MRILLTGVTGQVGSALLPRLGALGEVVPADRGTLDLSEPSSIAAALDRLAPDLIVNPAAYTAVDKAEDEPALAYTVNARAPEAIAAWAAPKGVPLVHFSTDYVFDGSGTRPWREDDPTGPLSVYGASKLAGEEAIRATGGPHLIVRTCWVYAATGRNFLRTIARLASEREELRIVADQIGAPTSARLIAESVIDLIRATTASAENWTAIGGVINLAASGTTSWHGFASAIVDGLRDRGAAIQATKVVDISSSSFPTRAQRPTNSRFDLAKLTTHLGRAPIDWYAALQPELDLLARQMIDESGR